MDENNITHHWKQYKRYWGLVVRRAIPNAWVRLGGFFAIIVPTAIGVWLSLHDKPFESLAEFGARPEMMPYFAFIMIAILFALLLFSLEPVKLYEEQGGFEDGKLIIKSDCADTEPNGYFAIWLYSKTGFDVTECYVTLRQAAKDSEPTYHINRPIALALSNESQYASEINSLPAYGHRKVDIAYAFPNTHQMKFRVVNGDSYPSGNGDFHITLEMHGIYRVSSLDVSLPMDFSYDGDTTFICNQKEIELTLKKGKMGYEAGSVIVL